MSDLRKVCVVVNSRANYGRIKSVLTEIQNSAKLKLQVIVGASALLYRFGNVVSIMKADGFYPDSVVHSIVEGETPTTMAKSTGLAIVELATHFENLKPDIVLTVADRFETLATAVAASYMNIPVAHTQGGEVTGSIDESVRHAITKLSHIHFPATTRAEKFLRLLGENPNSIHLTGCPSIDILNNLNFSLDDGFFEKYKGVGSSINPQKKYIVVLQHPVTTEYGDGLRQINETLQAVNQIGLSGMQVVWLWPNVDAGSDDISKGLRVFREQHSPNYLHFYRNFTPEDYARLINSASCLVGNSSSGLREGAYLGVPCVNIGSRQRGRERAINVMDVPYDSKLIKDAISKQIENGRYPKSTIIGDGSAGLKIAKVLEKTSLNINKELNYLNQEASKKK
jgi:UDP-hydrolysing UDP-N-acetyl-D-glucosamine 2-epimerase